MHIAILTFEGFNELDSFIALGILNRVKRLGWRVAITSPSERVQSMNGVLLESQASLRDASDADAVIVGSGVRTRDIVANADLMNQLKLDPSRQLVGAQCSGTLVLAKLGLLNAVPACTDLTTKPWVEEAGVAVLNQPIFASGNVATAGGCLSSQYLAAWIIARLVGLDEAESALRYVAPVGEKDDYVTRAIRTSRPTCRASRMRRAHVRRSQLTRFNECADCWRHAIVVCDRNAAQPLAADGLASEAEYIAMFVLSPKGRLVQAGWDGSRCVSPLPERCVRFGSGP